MIERYEDIPIEKLVIDRFQVRKSNTGEEIETLAASIQEFGLLHPIVVSISEYDSAKWEVVCGQRRLLAHKKLGKQKIKAGVIDRVLSEDEGLAISGNENVHQLDMTRTDLIDLCEKLFLRYGTLKAVWEKTRLPYDMVRKYVRYSRLEPNLKSLVDNNALPVDLAIKSQDAATVDGVYSPERAEELVDVLQESDDELRKRILEVNKSNPTAEVSKIVESAKKPDTRLKISFTMGPSYGDALRKYAEGQDADPSVAAQDMLESSLDSMGLVENN
ncbi:MAG: ParB N-terminal domain-containing protein [Gammaproteobacteria bacterium]|nr:ParB N-terminal domain-containing protein [Gammaproteobacteria bacterium]